MTERRPPAPLTMWALGILWSLVIFLVGGFLGDIKGSLSVRGVREELVAHESMPGHPLSMQRQDAQDERIRDWMQSIDRRLERIEAKVDAGATAAR